MKLDHVDAVKPEARSRTLMAIFIKYAAEMGIIGSVGVICQSPVFSPPPQEKPPSMQHPAGASIAP
jgi:hypothetical protein